STGSSIGKSNSLLKSRLKVRVLPGAVWFAPDFWRSAPIAQRQSRRLLTGGLQVQVLLGAGSWFSSPMARGARLRSERLKVRIPPGSTAENALVAQAAEARE